MSEQLLKVAEAAKHLRVSPRTVYRLIDQGDIKACRIGKQWRIPISSMPGYGYVEGRPETS